MSPLFNEDKTSQPEKKKQFLKEEVASDQTLRNPQSTKPEALVFPLATSKGEASLSSRLTNIDGTLSANSNGSSSASLSLPGVRDEKSASDVGGDPAYAGFSMRVLAKIFDDNLFSLLTLPYLVVGFLGCSLMLHWLPRLTGSAVPPLSDPFMLCLIIGVGIVLYIFLGWFYYAGYESSEVEATLGKRLLGLKVLNTDGTRFTLGHSTIKMLIMPGFIVLICVLLLVWALVGIKSSIFSILGTVLLFAAFMICMFGNAILLNKKKQTLVDIIAKRVVVKSVRVPQGVSGAGAGVVAGASLGSEKAPPRFKLKTIDKQALAIAFATVPIFILEIAVAGLCNVNFLAISNTSPGAMVLNKSGNVLIANEDLQAGAVLDLRKCRTAHLSLFQTPPFAVDPAAQLGRTLLCSEIKSGTIIGYSQILPRTLGISSISAIEPLADSNYAVSTCSTIKSSSSASKKSEGNETDTTSNNPLAATFKSFNLTSPLDEFQANTEHIQELLQASSKFNQSKKFDQAFSSANNGIQKLIELEEKTNAVPGNETKALVEGAKESLMTSRTVLEPANLVKLPEGFRAVSIDLLVQRSLARQGLQQTKLAHTDAVNSLSLLRSLHENFTAMRTSEFSLLPDTDAAPVEQESSTQNADETAVKSADVPEVAVDEQSERYLKMLGASDEKLYQNILLHIRQVLKQLL